MRQILIRRVGNFGAQNLPAMDRRIRKAIRRQERRGYLYAGQTETFQGLRLMFVPARGTRR